MENEKLEEFKKLVEYYETYIHDKAEYIKLLDSGEVDVEDSYYFFQNGLLEAYQLMLNHFKELLGGEDNGKD